MVNVFEWLIYKINIVRMLVIVHTHINICYANTTACKRKLNLGWPMHHFHWAMEFLTPVLAVMRVFFHFANAATILLRRKFLQSTDTQ